MDDPEYRDWKLKISMQDEVQLIFAAVKLPKNYEILFLLPMHIKHAKNNALVYQLTRELSQFKQGNFPLGFYAKLRGMLHELSLLYK